MKRVFTIVLYVFLFLLVMQVASCVMGAEGDAGAAQPMPHVSAEADPVDTTVFGDRKRGDQGLKPIDPPRFEIAKPNVFSGFRILMWGVTIAGCLFGLFLAVVIVIFTLRFLRKDAIPAVTGVPAGSFEALKLFDEIVARVHERRKALEVEKAEIDKRVPPSSGASNA